MAKKIPSRKFPKSKTKIPSRKFAKAPKAASEEPVAPVLPDRPANEEARQDRLITLKGKLKSLTPVSKLASSSPPFKNETVTWSHSNLLIDLPRHLPDELSTTLLEAKHVRIERIVSTGHASPDGFWYDQEEHEWVVVLKGEAKIVFQGNDEPIHVKPGDYINIEAHRKHRVEWTSPDEPTVWLAVFYKE